MHPYLDGVGEGRAVLDSIRVARRFGGTSTAVVEGFSQGSQAAIFAGQEWSSYAPDIDLRPVVAIGTPARYGQAFAALDLPVVRSYIGKVLAGIVAGHPSSIAARS
ncbi:MAG: lipase family protein [Acidimicrobiales bacterium]